MWIILILILVLITTITTVNGGNSKYIYIKKSNTGNIIATTGYIYNLYNTQAYLYKHFYSFIIRDMLMQNLNTPEYYLDTKYLNLYKSSNPDFDIDFYTKNITEFIKIYTENKYEFTTKPGKHKLCPYILPKRKLLDKTVSTELLLNCVAMNWILNSISPGNQWTLLSETQVNKLINLDFKIECFGSAYNTRFPWFGSISELDNPWGRIGTYSEIFNTLIQGKPLMWQNTVIYAPENVIRITANPPSLLCTINFLNELNALLEARKGTIYIDISNRDAKVTNEFMNSKWYRCSRISTKAYSLWNNKVHDMKTREWINIIFSNEDIDANMFLIN